MMNQILIKTFVLGANHGQFLQAYGLKYFLEKEYPNSRIVHPLYTNHLAKELLIHFRSLTLFKYLRFLFAWFHNFHFVGRKARLPLVIYGSDMIFHLQSPLFKPDSYYFNRNHPDEKSVAFAPSTSWRDKTNEPSFIEGLRSFYAISVRDQSTAELVSECTGFTPEVVCDPAFFIDKSLFAKKLSQYSSNNVHVALYGSQSVLKTNIPITCFNSNKYTIHNLAYYPRSQFFKYFLSQLQDPLLILSHYNSSDFVLTTTFHGLIMALITKKPFLAYADKNLLARLSHYIPFFDSSRIITNDSPALSLDHLESLTLHTNDINYSSLDLFISDSKDWLRHQVYSTSSD